MVGRERPELPITLINSDTYTNICNDVTGGIMTRFFLDSATGYIHRHIRRPLPWRNTMCEVDAALLRYAQHDEHMQDSDRKIRLQPVACRPANRTPVMQIKNDERLEPSFLRTNIADFARLIPVWVSNAEVSP